MEFCIRPRIKEFNFLHRWKLFEFEGNNNDPLTYPYFLSSYSINDFTQASDFCPGSEIQITYILEPI